MNINYNAEIWFEMKIEETTELKEIKAWFKENQLNSKAKEKKKVQPKMTEFIENLDEQRMQQSFCNYMKDCHDIATVGRRRPDIVHYRKGFPQTVFNIVCLGELKGRRKTPHFSDNEKGQILETTLMLAHFQPFRTEFSCYLTDTKYIQLYKIVVTRKVRYICSYTRQGN